MMKLNPDKWVSRGIVKFIPVAIVLTVFVVVFPACDQTENEIVTDNDEVASSPVMKPDAAPQMPAFKLSDASGNIIELQSFKGRKVFVNLWATWCPPCRAELPSIEKLYTGSDRNSSQFVMISFDNNFQTALSFAERSGMKTPVYFPAQQLPELFNVQGIPATFIFDEEGKLIKKIEGASRYDTREYFEMLK